MLRIVVDAMGGDNAPLAILEGVCRAIPELDLASNQVLIVGDLPQIESAIVASPQLKRLRKHLPSRRPDAESSAQEQGTKGTTEIPVPMAPGIAFLHAPEVIEMADTIRAIRNKPNASINVGCRLAAEGYQASKTKGEAPPASPQAPLLAPPTAFISAGNSGAVMASALLNLGRLGRVERPAIAVILPTLSPAGCVLVDAGANVDCKPSHLRDFAVMGALFAQAEQSAGALARVGILSNGEESSKGNELTRQASELICKSSLFELQLDKAFSSGPPPESNQAPSAPTPKAGIYTGYVEGKELFKGHVDVVVTDGFVGNVVLKALEGLGSAIVELLKAEIPRNPLTPLGYLLSFTAFRRLKRKLDYAEYGAAPLLGVSGYVFICHGRSGPKAIKNAILRTRTALQSGFVQKLESALDAAPRDQ